MSTSKKEVLAEYDSWLNEEGPAALVMREWLEPVEGKDTPIFPATFATTENDDDEDSKGEYNIDKSIRQGEEGKNFCLIDSVGSQANRVEPMFKSGKYKSLVPQISVKVGEMRDVHLLDAGHRAADAIVRFSTLQPKLAEAFKSIQVQGDVEPLARIAPTSLLFGVWDSRGSNAKLPRLITSVIRAVDVQRLTRSATYRATVDYVAEAGINEKFDAGSGKKNQLSREGMKYALATSTPGGVVVHGCICRHATLSLSGIRQLRASTVERSKVVQRYVLGLALCALTERPSRELRQGCHLVLDASHKPNPECMIVGYDGVRKPFSLDNAQATELRPRSRERIWSRRGRAGSIRQRARRDVAWPLER